MSREDIAREEMAFRMMKAETKNPILQVTDTELAKKLGMEDGKFYCYYKPSHLNGYASIS